MGLQLISFAKYGDNYNMSRKSMPEKNLQKILISSRDSLVIAF